jgi:hypothetical protein
MEPRSLTLACSGWDASFVVLVANALQVLAFCGALQLAGWKQDESSFPGDFSASSFLVGRVGANDPETQKTIVPRN